MSVLSMDWYGILGFYKRIDKLNLFLTGMSGNMGILEDYICTFSAQLIDNFRYCFLISRNRIRTKNNGIIWFDGNFFMDISRHTGKSRHRLTLASCSDQDYLIIRIVFNLIDLYKGLVRNLQISQLLGSANNIYHTPPFHSYLSSILISRINNLLHSFYVRRKGSNNDPGIPVFRKNIIKGLSHRPFRHGKSFSFRICTVTHQGQDAFFPNLRKSLQINGISEYRGIVHFKVSCMDDSSCRRIDCQGRSILNTVVCLDKFNPETSQINGLSVFDYFSLGSSQ